MEQKGMYADLFEKQRQSQLGMILESWQQRRRAVILSPATLPEAPSFPNRVLYAAGGLSGGLALGFFLLLRR